MGRAASLVWLAFGDDVPSVNYRGEQTVRPELALHLQCRWQLLRAGNVLVEQRDLFVPGSRGGGSEFVAGGEIGSARFDDRVEGVAAMIGTESPVVETVSVDEHFAFWLTLSDGVSLEAFPAEREGCEDWRFISFAGAVGGRRHYVVENGSLSTT
jgi:hypothetical protein